MIGARLAPPLLAPLLIAPLLIAADAPAVPQYLQERPVTRLDEPTAWRTCSFDVDKEDGLAECATVIVPADAADPERGGFGLFVKRRKVIGTPSAQVWILHGGPGASATEGLKRLSYDIPALRSDLQYYAVDHRGVGGSERLECGRAQASDSPKGTTIAIEEWPDCIAQVKETVGDRLDLFSTTHAARDVGALVEKYRLPGVPVFIYGASYGTYLARRYLQIFPEQPRGVILEGIADSRDHMTGYDAAMIRAADELLDRCARSPACGARFEGPPAAAIRRALDGLDRGRCAALGLTTSDAKTVLTGMTFTAPTRVLVPALARRIGRCGPGDAAIAGRALQAYLASITGKGYSSVLHNHVALSEMYTPARATRALQKQVDEAALSTGLELGYSKIESIWPKYPRDRFVGNEPDYGGPLLMLHGRLDTPSPLARALPMRDRFRGARQYWVEFPEGAHGMTSRTPTPDGSDCGRSIYLQFIDRPDRAPDTGCIARILPIDWNSTPDDAMRFLGTLDIWDGRTDDAAPQAR